LTQSSSPATFFDGKAAATGRTWIAVEYRGCRRKHRDVVSWRRQRPGWTIARSAVRPAISPSPPG